MPSTKVRRTLMIVTKILQNLANGTDFEKKESFMKPANQFLIDNAKNLDKIFKVVVVLEGKREYSIDKPQQVSLFSAMKITEDDIEMMWGMIFTNYL